LDFADGDRWLFLRRVSLAGHVASRLGAADGIAISSRAIFRPSRSKSARVIRKEKLTSVVEKFSCPIFADGINAVGRTIS
jgi:hypothetical protein